MSKVYVINEDGSTETMTEIQCENEDLELQRILEKNPDLVPGDQINPSDPRRWLIVKREMPVPDPNTGTNRWSIDLFFIDQEAVPTFIECKRFNDTRSRREVIGQMLEYAANGHYYWSKDEMRQFAEETAQQKNLTLEEEIQRIQIEEPDTADVFFQKAQDNLREGQIRLVFFLEKAPIELRSVVDYLNKQMERSEVLLVEARQFEYKGTKVVAPILFGFTEEARQVKKTISVTTGQKRKWNKESFFKDAKERLNENELTAIARLFDKSQALKSEISWGRGKEYGSFSVKWSHLFGFSLFIVYTDGALTIYFGSFQNKPEAKEFIKFFKEKLEKEMGLSFPKNYDKKWPNFKASEWIKKIDAFLKVLDELLQKFPTINNV